MKKELVILLVMASTATLLSASGNNNKDDQDYGRGYHHGSMMGSSESDRADHREYMEEFLEDAERISISGTLNLVNGEMATIESGGVIYTIMAPWDQLEDLNLTDGKTISLEGVEMASRRWMWDGSEKSIMVTKFTIDGVETEITHDGSSFPGKGHGSGRRGGSGRSGDTKRENR